MHIESQECGADATYTKSIVSERSVLLLFHHLPRSPTSISLRYVFHCFLKQLRATMVVDPSISIMSLIRQGVCRLFATGNIQTLLSDTGPQYRLSRLSVSLNYRPRRATVRQSIRPWTKTQPPLHRCSSSSPVHSIRHDLVSAVVILLNHTRPRPLTYQF